MAVGDNNCALCGGTSCGHRDIDKSNLLINKAWESMKGLDLPPNWNLPDRVDELVRRYKNVMADNERLKAARVTEVDGHDVLWWHEECRRTERSMKVARDCETKLRGDLEDLKTVAGRLSALEKLIVEDEPLEPGDGVDASLRFIIRERKRLMGEVADLKKRLDANDIEREAEKAKREEQEKNLLAMCETIQEVMAPQPGESYIFTLKRNAQELKGAKMAVEDTKRSAMAANTDLGHKLDAAKKDAADWKREYEMLMNGVRRELKDNVAPKYHTIDALVQGVKSVVAAKEKFDAWLKDSQDAKQPGPIVIRPAPLDERTRWIADFVARWIKADQRPETIKDLAELGASMVRAAEEAANRGGDNAVG